MAHFDAALPGRVHRVFYESLIEDTEAQVRRLLAHCGLPFEAACLRFYENERAVRTASSEQVRRPIFRDGHGPLAALRALARTVEGRFGAGARPVSGGAERPLIRFCRIGDR
jgi:hypothetical protein